MSKTPLFVRAVQRNAFMRLKKHPLLFVTPLRTGPVLACQELLVMSITHESLCSYRRENL